MQDIDTSAIALVDALHATYGRHPGVRATHAKGVCALGEFLPAAGAADFIASPMFSRRALPAAVRFSVGGGAPCASDKSRSTRGLALRLEAGAERYDLVLLSEPVFCAATLESFLALLRARVPDPATGQADPARLAAHVAAYPDGARQSALLAAHAAPASYATTPYYSNNAFLFTGSAGQVRPARIVVQPEAGIHYLSDAQAAGLPDTFLEAELDERLHRGPIAFQLRAVLPSAGDSLTDPSTEWRGAGSVTLGRLLVQALTAGDCDAIGFAPTTLPPAVGLSADPILQARQAAYAVSERRRTLTRPMRAAALSGKT